MRRSELLGLKWSDMDWKRGTVSISRGLVCVGYELSESRCKTRTSRRLIELDQTTLELHRTWHGWRRASDMTTFGVDSVWMFPGDDRGPTHPHAFSQAFDRLVIRSGNPTARLHDLRHTHATLLIKQGIPVKVVSERLGHARASFTMDTYQAVMPGMQADAATTYEQIMKPGPNPQHASTGAGR